MKQPTDKQFADRYKEAVRLSHHVLNAHNPHLVDDATVHHLAAHLFDHVQPGSGKPGPDRAGADADQDDMLVDGYGKGQGGNFS